MAKGTKTDKGRSPRTIKEIRENRSSKSVLATATAVIVGIWSIFVLIFVSLKNPDDGSHQSLPTIDDTKDCIDCKSLLLNFSQSPASAKDPFKDDLTKGQDGDKKCCPLNETEIETILTKIMDVQDSYLARTTQPPAEHLKGLPVAHKSILPGTQVHESAESGHVPMHRMRLNVSGTSKPLEFVRNVQVDDDGFTINLTGMYFVYCSILFRKNEIVNPETWYLHVVRVRPPGFNNLLKGVYTVCQDCREPQETVFTGGVFHLLTGDKIQVRLSGLNIVDFGSQSTFFGVVMLAS